MKEELNLEQLEMVTGGGKLEDTYNILKSAPSVMAKIKSLWETEGKIATVGYMIDVIKKERPDLICYANDLIGHIFK